MPKADDKLGAYLRERVTALMAARDMDRGELMRLIRRKDSWVSEFLGGKRFPNDLRLVVRLARVFGVPVGDLLGERESRVDAGATTILAAWRACDHQGRDVLLNVAVSLLKRAAPADGGEQGSASDQSEGRERTRVKGEKPRRVKRQ